jgi:hypothetical protein
MRSSVKSWKLDCVVRPSAMVIGPPQHDWLI